MYMLNVLIYLELFLVKFSFNFIWCLIINDRLNLRENYIIGGALLNLQAVHFHNWEQELVWNAFVRGCKNYLLASMNGSCDWVQKHQICLNLILYSQLYFINLMTEHLFDFFVVGLLFEAEWENLLNYIFHGFCSSLTQRLNWIHILCISNC